MTHTLRPTRENQHGAFHAAMPPILRIASGDRILASTLDARWHDPEQADLAALPTKVDYAGKGHALIGPIAVEGAEPGDALEIRLETIRPGAWGWTAAGGWPSEVNERLGVSDAEPHRTNWRIEGDRAVDPRGRTIALNPFLGWIGLMPAAEGEHSTTPPRRMGGNLDCKELCEGTRLFLPVEVAGGLLSFGDGHAAQGDGEVSGIALECPMDRVEMTVVLHRGAAPRLPYAHTPAGLLTMGFSPNLDDATIDALNGLVDLMAARMGVSRPEALSLASLRADLRITQVVNETKGVHAVLSTAAITELGLLSA